MPVSGYNLKTTTPGEPERQSSYVARNHPNSSFGKVKPSRTKIFFNFSNCTFSASFGVYSLLGVEQAKSGCASTTMCPDSVEYAGTTPILSGHTFLHSFVRFAIAKFVRVRLSLFILRSRFWRHRDKFPAVGIGQKIGVKREAIHIGRFAGADGEACMKIRYRLASVCCGDGQRMK